MSPLVALLLFGFMFVIALSLTIWAALTLGDGAHRFEDDDSAVSYVPIGSHRPVWRSDEAERTPLQGLERRRQPNTERANGRRGSDPLPRTTGLPAVSPQAAVPVAPVVRPPASPSTQPQAPAQMTASSRLSNDEYRGARATVTQRPNNDDAFERFLENDRER